jgi:hypothetical protein
MKHESFNESAEMYLKTVSELAGPDALAPISALGLLPTSLIAVWA